MTLLDTIIGTMSPAQRKQMLRDIIQNMIERNDGEEIARFVSAQLDGDAIEVASAYAQISNPEKQP